MVSFVHPISWVVSYPFGKVVTPFSLFLLLRCWCFGGLIFGPHCMFAHCGRVWESFPSFPSCSW